jgi:TPP-dependent trihydroxycyclohexane-1,2-dione (THcHDO) dehydratase
MKTIRLTVAQAVIKYLNQQYVERVLKINFSQVALVFLDMEMLLVWGRPFNSRMI